MTVKEIVLTMENKPGELARIVSHLYENDVNLSACLLNNHFGYLIIDILMHCYVGQHHK